TGNFDVWLRQSSDSGMTFSNAQQLTDSTTAELYPFEARDSMNIHVVFPQAGVGVSYLYSGDGGSTWNPSFNIGPGGQPYVTYTGCTVHVIWVNTRRIYYRRNPTGNGNCIPTSIPDAHSPAGTLSIYPDPATNEIVIGHWTSVIAKVIISDATGRIVFSQQLKANSQQPTDIDISKLKPEVYFINLTDEKNISTFGKFVKL